MKKLALFVLSIFMMLALLVACDEKPAPSVTGISLSGDNKFIVSFSDGTEVVAGKVSVSEDKHLIVTYEDGTEHDLGYVGVEPVVQTYTVTFVDEDGTTVLGEVSVLEGEGAKAPNPPIKLGKIFKEWDTDFTNVQSDLTVKAVYREPGTFTVKFMDYNGLSLGESKVTEGETAKAPSNPTREGYSFSSWSSSLSNITGDKTVTAQYSFKGGDNVIELVPFISGNKLTLTVKIKGTVKICGLEGSIQVPSGLTFVKNTDNAGTMANYQDGTIYFMFSSPNGQNITSETTLTTLEFTITSGSSCTVNVNISDAYDQGYEDVAYSVIGKTIKLK